VLGGEVPTVANSSVYQDTFYLKETAVLKAAVFQNGAMASTMAEANFRIVPKTKEDPVKFQIFYGEKMEKLPDFSTLKPVKEGYIMEFSHKQAVGPDIQQDQVALVLESYLEIEKEGKYRFFTNSDDGSKLYVDGTLVVDNDGDHGVMERSGTMELAKGSHKVRVEFFNGGGGYHLDVKYQGKDVPKQIVPANKLYRVK
jgi:hypothetical protein